MGLAQQKLAVCLRQGSLRQPIMLQGKRSLAGCGRAQGSLSLSWWKSHAYWEDKLGAPLRDLPGWEKSYQSRAVIFAKEKFEWILSNLLTNDVKCDVHKGYLFWPALCSIIRKINWCIFQEVITIIGVCGAHTKAMSEKRQGSIEKTEKICITW